MTKHRFGLFIALMLALSLSACQTHAEPVAPSARVVFFDVGKADAILIETEKSAVLLDTGHKKTAEALLQALDERAIYALDALIITHFDKDHIGGAPAVLEAMPVKTVYQPDYEKSSKRYDDYVDALGESDAKVVTLGENIEFELDGMRLGIDVANERYYGEDEENDFSLVLTVEVGDARALFAGDAEAPRLKELIDENNLKCELLKVPHHGRYEKVSPLFFAAAGARYAVITSSDDDPEEPETLGALAMAGTEVYLTREGTITATTDGQTWTIAQEAA